MCAVSMVGDHFGQKFGPYIFPTPAIWPPYTPAPRQPPVTIPNLLPSPIPPSAYSVQPPVTRAEFDQLKRDVEDMKLLLARAKKYDEDTGQADCQIDDKIELLKKIAALVGVSLEDIFPK